MAGDLFVTDQGTWKPYIVRGSSAYMCLEGRGNGPRRGGGIGRGVRVWDEHARNLLVHPTPERVVVETQCLPRTTGQISVIIP